MPDITMLTAVAAFTAVPKLIARILFAAETVALVFPLSTANVPDKL